MASRKKDSAKNERKPTFFEAIDAWNNSRFSTIGGVISKVGGDVWWQHIASIRAALIAYYGSQQTTKSELDDALKLLTQVEMASL